jgi:hypothetical protein
MNGDASATLALAFRPLECRQCAVWEAEAGGHAPNRTGEWHLQYTPLYGSELTFL